MHCLVVTFDKYWVFHVFLFVDAKKRGRGVIISPPLHIHVCDISKQMHSARILLAVIFSIQQDRVNGAGTLCVIFCGWIRSLSWVSTDRNERFFLWISRSMPFALYFHRHNNPSKLNSSKRTFVLSVFRLTWYIREFKQ